MDDETGTGLRSFRSGDSIRVRVSSDHIAAVRFDDSLDCALARAINDVVRNLDGTPVVCAVSDTTVWFLDRDRFGNLPPGEKLETCVVGSARLPGGLDAFLPKRPREHMSPTTFMMQISHGG